MMAQRVILTTADHDAVYAEVIGAVQRVAARFPGMTNLEVFAVIGQAAGISIGLSAFADERDLARQHVIENMDAGIARADAMRGTPAPMSPAASGRPL